MGSLQLKQRVKNESAEILINWTTLTAQNGRQITKRREKRQ
jgi:hypothetical protein